MGDDLPKLDIGLSAKAEIKTEIPSEASGRLVHALVDALSPFTETLGLVGDQIRSARRERAIGRIASAQKLLEEQGRPVAIVPDSFLLPWIERTSQDEADDGLEEAWINLLASASSAYTPRMRAFPSILSELTGVDVKFLDALCSSPIYDDRSIVFSVNKHLTDMRSALGSIVSPAIDASRLKSALDSRSDPFFAGKSLEVNGGPGGAIYTNSSIYDELGSGLSVMEKNGLLISFTEVLNAKHIRMDITYVRVTRLGFEFVRAARGESV